jgi:hypothetical protein
LPSHRATGTCRPRSAGFGRDRELKTKIAAPIREVPSAAFKKYGHLAERRSLASARHLLDVLDRVPVFIIPCLQGRPPADPASLSSFYGLIYPAV